MKKRNGFVSNSSSSSFIVGIGQVLDKQKLLDLFPDDIEILTVKEIREKTSCWGIYNSNGYACYDSFMYDTVRINMNELEETDEIAYFSYHYGDDSDFYDEDGYYNYDIEVEDETADQIYEVFQDSDYIKNTDLAAGAGRDG